LAVAKKDTGSVTAELVLALPAVVMIVALALGAMSVQLQRMELVSAASTIARAIARGEPIEIVDALVTAAEGIGRTPVETAIAWLRDRPGVGSVILGARNIAQLKILLSSDNLVLPEELNNALSDVSAPHSSYPESGWAQLPKDRGN
jgi:aryl-alcohol dehydrogenase-like predicted oxidoreductase